MASKRQNKDHDHNKSRQWIPLEGCTWKVMGEFLEYGKVLSCLVVTWVFAL